MNTRDETPLDYCVNPKRHLVREMAQMEMNDLKKRNLSEGTYRLTGQQKIQRELYADNDKVTPSVLNKRAERAKSRALQRRTKTKVKDDINSESPIT